jgi:hypothetical protein
VKSQNQTLSHSILSRCPLPTAVEPHVQIFNLSDELAKFRAQLEHEAGAPLQEIELNAALLLDDLCAFLEFGETQRAKIMGPTAIAFVDRFLGPEPDVHAESDQEAR